MASNEPNLHEDESQELVRGQSVSLACMKIASIQTLLI